MVSAFALAFFLQAPDCAAGAEAFRQGHLDRARELVAASLEKRSTAYCEKVMGVVYAAAKQHRQAELHFAKSCALDTREVDACYFWSRSLYSLDRFEESLQALRKAEGASLDWKILSGRGQALDALGSPEAEAVLRKAVEARKKDPKPPGEIDPLLALSALLYRQGDTAKVVALLRNAVGYGNVAPFQYQFGKALLAEGETAEAEEHLLAAIRLQPQYPEAHGLLSRLYDRQGKTGLAGQHRALAKVQ